MKALVTGGTGFVGSHLVERFVSDGQDVAVLTRAGADDRRIAGWRPSLTWIEGDLRDLASARAEITDFAPEVVFHLGWGGVGKGGRDDRSQIDANLAGTLALFDLVADAGCSAFVGLGSQAEYGDVKGEIDEATPTRPTTLYGAAKASAALRLDRLADAAGVRFAWLRLFSAYGPADHPDALIPSLIRALDAGEAAMVRFPDRQWDYLYAGDAASAIARVGGDKNVSGTFNLASGRRETLRRVAERVRDLIGPSRPVRFGESDGDDGPGANVFKLSAAIGPIARVGLDEGLMRTIAWHRRNAAVRRTA